MRRNRFLPTASTIVIAIAVSISLHAQGTGESVGWAGGVSYEYDRSGNPMKIGKDSFYYDRTGRLVYAKVNDIERRYEYDAFGNRAKCLHAPGTADQSDCNNGYMIDAAAKMNRLKDAGYDARGNVTGLFQRQYSYDAVNMMLREQAGGLAREFIYTADDERIAVHTLNTGSWNWTPRDSAGRVLREYTSKDQEASLGTGSWQWVKDYVWRGDLLLASVQWEGTKPTTYHYHLDHLGTPRRITDARDDIAGFHDYFAFGPEANGGKSEPSPTPLKYTGHERDIWLGDSVAALDYMHARYYSPTLARFHSVDPARTGRPGNPQSWNRYSYSANSPLKFYDKNGQYYELATPADRKFFVSAMARGTHNKAARELLIRQAGDPFHKIVLQTGNLTQPNAPATQYQYGDSSKLHPPYRVISGNLFPAGITTTVDAGKLQFTNYPTPTISVFHELKHVDLILYKGLAENARHPDQIQHNVTTGQVTTNSIFEDFGRAAATTADDPMHALTEEEVSSLIADPGEGEARQVKRPCPSNSILCLGGQ